MVPLEKLPYISWVDDSGQTRILRANVTTDEQIDLEAETTDHPVETGANVTDNIRKKPTKTTAELFFTDSITRTDILDKVPQKQTTELQVQHPPKFTFATLLSTSALLELGLNALTPTEKVFIDSYLPGTRPRYVEAFELINELMNGSKLVTVKTTMALFEEMAIESASFKRNASTGNGATITLGLKKILFVSSDVTLAIKLPKDARAQPKVDAGKGGSFDVPTAKVSTLKQGGNGIGLTHAGKGVTPITP